MYKVEIEFTSEQVKEALTLFQAAHRGEDGNRLLKVAEKLGQPKLGIVNGGQKFVLQYGKAMIIEESPGSRPRETT